MYRLSARRANDPATQLGVVHLELVFFLRRTALLMSRFMLTLATCGHVSIYRAISTDSLSRQTGKGHDNTKLWVHSGLAPLPKRRDALGFLVRFLAIRRVVPPSREIAIALRGPCKPILSSFSGTKDRLLLRHPSRPEERLRVVAVGFR